MLAKNANDNASSLTPRGARKFFASKLAPTLAACISQIRGSRQAAIAGKPAPTFDITRNCYLVRHTDAESKTIRMEGTSHA